MLRVAMLLAVVASTSALVVQTAARATVPQRLSAPRAQFGTSNYDKTQTDGFFLSPIPGDVKGASGKSPFSNVEGSSLAAPLFAATLSLPVIFIVALYGIGPGTKGPFDFLNVLFDLPTGATGA